MKLLQLVGLISSAAVLISCETASHTAGMGNQEQKRLAALQRQQTEDAEIDEGYRNLWNAQVDTLYRGTNPAIKY
jgi:hypothetical protein